MAYWKCNAARISDDGTAVTLGFADEHSVETMNITMPAEEWKQILIYRGAYREPERRMAEAHRQLCDYLWNQARMLAEPKAGEE